MTTIHVDLRELSGLAADAPINREAVLSFSPYTVIHVEDGADYLLTQNEWEVETEDGEATFELPPSPDGSAIRVRENHFIGAQIKCLVIPDVGGTVEYGDLDQIDCTTLEPYAVPEAAWWAALNNMIVSAHLDGDDLILVQQDGDEINVGSVVGPQGPPGTGTDYRLVVDDYDRPNSATVVGDPQVGPSPTVTTGGTGGINGNSLYFPVGRTNLYTDVMYETGEADVVAEVTLGTVTALEFPGLALRSASLSSSANAMHFLHDGAWRTVADVDSALGQYDTPLASGDRLRVVLQERSAKVYRKIANAGSWVLNATYDLIGTFETNTKHGPSRWDDGAGTSRYDDLWIGLMSPEIEAECRIADIAAMLARLIPAGGDADDALVKVSGTDYDMEWSPVSGAAATGDTPGLMIASFTDNSETNYTIPLIAGEYSGVPNMTMGIPPVDRPVLLEFGGHLLCTVAGNGTFYIGIGNMDDATNLLEQAANFRSGAFLTGTYSAIVGLLQGSHVIPPSDDWRLLILTCVLARDAASSLAGTLLSDQAAGLGTTTMAHTRPAFMRATLL